MGFPRLFAMFTAAVLAGSVSADALGAQKDGPVGTGGTFIDPMAHWTLDELTGNQISDCGPSRFHGAVIGAETCDGVLCAARQFGPGAYISVPGDIGYPKAIGDLQTGTISVWFNFAEVPPANGIWPIVYIGDGVGGVGNCSLIIELGHFEPSAKLYFTILAGDRPIQCYDSGAELQPNTWYHFAAVVGSDFNTGYLNGQEMTNRHYNFGTVASHYFLADVPNKKVFWIGRGFLWVFPTDQYFNGQIDDVRVYDRPLSSQDVSQYYAWATRQPRGDIDGDSHVDVVDLLWFVASSGTKAGDPAYNVYTDFNGDNMVDVVDLLILVQNFGL